MAPGDLPEGIYAVAGLTDLDVVVLAEGESLPLVTTLPGPTINTLNVRMPRPSTGEAGALPVNIALVTGFSDHATAVAATPSVVQAVAALGHVEAYGGAVVELDGAIVVAVALAGEVWRCIEAGKVYRKVVRLPL